MDDVEPRLMTVELAAEMLAVSRAQVYKLIKDGELPSVKIGRSRRLRRSTVLAYIDQHTEGAA